MTVTRVPKDPFQESVYQLIAKPAAQVEKAPRYRSTFADSVRETHQVQRGAKPAAAAGMKPSPRAAAAGGRAAPAKVDAPLNAAITPTGLYATRPRPAPGAAAATVPAAAARGATAPGPPPPPTQPTIASQARVAATQPRRGGAARDAQEAPEPVGPQYAPLPEEDRVEILDSLRAQRDRLCRDFGKMSLCVDTLGKINRKLALENEIKAVEADIRKFENPNILIVI